MNDTKGKKKVLGSNQKLKFNPTELILYCKDLRMIRFCFEEAGPESARKVSETKHLHALSQNAHLSCLGDFTGYIMLV